MKKFNILVSSLLLSCTLNSLMASDGPGAPFPGDDQPRATTQPGIPVPPSAAAASIPTDVSAEDLEALKRRVEAARLIKELKRLEEEGVLAPEAVRAEFLRKQREKDREDKKAEWVGKLEFAQQVRSVFFDSWTALKALGGDVKASASDIHQRRRAIFQSTQEALAEAQRRDTSKLGCLKEYIGIPIAPGVGREEAAEALRKIAEDADATFVHVKHMDDEIHRIRHEMDVELASLATGSGGGGGGS